MTIEECFLRAKDDLGLDHCEARSWHGWHRHMSLVMAAAAFLARVTANQRRAAYGKRNETSPRRQAERNESEAASGSGMMARLAQTMTTLELRHLISRLLPRPILTATFIWDWSRWRREHQVAAAIAHRKTRHRMQL